MTLPVAGVILAGGRSRRMGGRDKSFVELRGKSLIAHVTARLRPQVAALAINSNADPAAFSGFGLRVIADTLPGYQGPLAGILSGMRWALSVGFPAIATVAVDTPFFPLDLVARLAKAGDTGIAVARSAGRLHPTFALLPAGLADDLERFIRRGETLKLTDWLAARTVVAVDFENERYPPFFNINVPADLATATTILDPQDPGLPETP